MRKIALLFLLLPLTLAPGCPVRRFEVTMESGSDGTVNRELTVWVAEDGKVREPGEDVLTAARSAYNNEGEAVDRKYRFSGAFRGKLPDDLIHEGLTNSGFFDVLDGRMGRVCTYVERMPGRTDLAEVFRRGEEFTDTTVRVLVAWAGQQSELKSQPERLAKLEEFLRTEFRDDMLNVLLMGWQALIRMNFVEDRGGGSGDIASDAMMQGEGFRFISYAVERGYLQPGEGLLLDEQTAVAAYRGVLHKAAQAMGYAPTDPLPAPLDRLTDPDSLETVLDEGLQVTGMTEEQYHAILEPALPAIFGGSTEGRVVWRIAIKPVQTNGKWDAKKGELSWEGLGRQGCASSQLFFAVWAEPDQEFQRTHFDKVILSGESLHEYINWRRELSEDERSQWDAFVTALRPGQDLNGELERFRFRSATTTPTSMPTTQPVEERPRGASLILDALGVRED